MTNRSLAAEARSRFLFEFGSAVLFWLGAAYFLLHAPAEITRCALPVAPDRDWLVHVMRAWSWAAVAFGLIWLSRVIHPWLGKGQPWAMVNPEAFGAPPKVGLRSMPHGMRSMRDRWRGDSSISRVIMVLDGAAFFSFVLAIPFVKLVVCDNCTNYPSDPLCRASVIALLGGILVACFTYDLSCSFPGRDNLAVEKLP